MKPCGYQGCTAEVEYRIEFWNRGKNPDEDPHASVCACGVHKDDVVRHLEMIQRIFGENAGGVRVVMLASQN